MEPAPQKSSFIPKDNSPCSADLLVIRLRPLLDGERVRAVGEGCRFAEVVPTLCGSTFKSMVHCSFESFQLFARR